MNTNSLLYDEPGPRARRRALIGTVVSLLAIGALATTAVRRLVDQGQFDWERWRPLLDPRSETFILVWQLLGKGLLATLVAALIAITLSLIIGTAIGVIRMMLGRWTRLPVVAFIELFRGLPVVVTIFLTWRFFVDSGIDISWLPGEDGLWYLVIASTLYSSVIIAEIIRAGVLSLPRGQGEAGTAIGLTRWQVMHTILLPQGLRVMLPALISQLVVVLKDTSLAAVAAGLYIELLRQGNLIAQYLHNPLQVLVVVGAIYVALNWTLSKVAVLLEARSGRTRPGTDVAAAQEVVPTS